MRIRYITDSYPPVVNGVSYVVNNLAETLVGKGHDVEVLTIDDSFSLPQEEVVNGVTVKRFKGLRPGNSYHFPSPEIIREIRREADVIHVHNFHSVMPFLVGFFLDRNQELAKRVVTPHYHTPGHHFHSKIAWVPYKRMLMSTIKNFDVIHCVSRFESNNVQRDFQVNPIVVANGVPSDVRSFQWGASQANSELSVLFVGRLEKYKRVGMLLDACAIAQRVRKLKLTIVGSGAERQSIEDYAKHLGIRVELIAKVERLRLLELYSTSSCLVNCSEFEAFSIVTAEALAIGTPVVVVKPWGITFKGYPRAAVVEPNPKSVSDAILACERLSNNEIRPVATWPEIADQMCEAVYNGK